MVDHVVRRSLWNGLRRSCVADNPPLSLDEYEARNAASFAAFAAEVAPQPLLSRWRADPQNPLLMLLLFSIHGCSAAAVVGAHSWPYAGCAALLGLFCADAMTGLVHIALDYTPVPFADPLSRTPFELACFGFQYHHVKPDNWLTADMWYYGICRTGLSFYFPMAALHWLAWARLADFANLVLYVVLHVGMFCQVSHAAAHGRWASSRWVKLLQRSGLWVSPAAHRLHHCELDKNFCIVNGWANPLVDRLFRTLVAHRLPPSMTPAVQREVYIARRAANAVEAPPYHGLVPGYRERLRHRQSSSRSCLARPRAGR